MTGGTKESLPFLLEIGCEEIPDWMIPGALKQLGESFGGFLEKNSIAGRVTGVDATPRRLVLRAEIAARQPDAEEMVMGPPKSAGFGAATGFAKKMGTTPDLLATQTTSKGEYFYFQKLTKGQDTGALLAAALPQLILGIHFPKTMYWNGKGTSRFIRPIRWLLALLDDQVIPFAIEGIHSGSMTRGHRVLGSASIEVDAGNYEEALAANGVLLGAAARREKIETAIAPLIAHQSNGKQLRLRPDAGLLDTLVYITELPTPILGHFDPRFLELPSEVLVTVMRHHQKYFSVEDTEGSLAPYFIAVMNTSADPDGLVRHGNERVLRARFNDARFFWEGDRKRRLEDRLPDLDHVTFQAKLGSYLDKTTRLVELVAELGGSDNAQRAALLSKCDLTTSMVKEFTDLQGVMGGLYAKAQDEADEVWRAIYDQYKPASMEDSLPETESGRLLSFADKLDTLRECFRIGLAPSGSRDPFALRRAAQGMVRILVESGLELPLQQLIDNTQLMEFLRDRVEYYFRDVRGFQYDEVRAVLAAGWENLPDVQRRLEALTQARPTEDFEPLAASFKRIQNILKQADFVEPGPVDEYLLEAGPEKDLHADFLRVREIARSSPYPEALGAIATLRPAVDLFFDKVLVNAKDDGVRRNRLKLLSNLLTEFSTIADFSEIVTDKNTQERSVS
ncbi:MAG: glycine--tRNA ligase subunit beta [Acidobacteriota bacterium]|nr:glycine--tRNA ligase subunit beta [Acidobacteriota bacterium]